MGWEVVSFNPLVVTEVVNQGGGGGGAVDSVAGKVGDVTLVKSDVGLDQVDNTSDLNKPLSTAVTAALAGKVSTNTTVAGKPLTASVTLTASDVGAVANTITVAGHPLSANVTLAKGDVGLGNVDNTADVDKPVSTAQQAALDLKLDSASAVVNFSDLGGKIGYSQMASGSIVSVSFTSSNYTTLTRPSVAAGVRVWWIGDATTSSSTLPTNAQSGDIVDTAS